MQTPKRMKGNFIYPHMVRGPKYSLRFQKINVMREYRTCDIAKHEA